jgi:putative Mn2+ efflux pump MntP
MESITIETLFLLALGVSADAFAVAVGHGAAARRLARTEALRVALFFGAFQALMPAIGWFVGHRFRHMIEAWDHWLAFVLLAGIGGKMIWDDFHPEEDEALTEERISTGHLLTLAVATSIDALAVGVGLLFLPSITATALTIGAVTFTLSLAGVLLGHRFRSLASRHSKTVGGIILILIGAKILADHLGLWGG